MTQPIERHDIATERRAADFQPYDLVFPRWFTLLLAVAWVAVMGWAITFSSITFT
jgi:hypothetical protein